MNYPFTLAQTPTFRRIFPSFDWDEDVWRVNQILYPAKIIGRENIGFEKGVPTEEIKSSNSAIKKWIDENMNRCSCVIFFVGDKTYTSKWVKYEMEQAIHLEKACFIINLKNVKNIYGNYCLSCPDPFRYHNLYDPNGSYIVKKYDWSPEYGFKQIHDWIEDACQRAGK